MSKAYSLKGELEGIKSRTDIKKFKSNDGKGNT